jgi:hypothetical protein
MIHKPASTLCRSSALVLAARPRSARGTVNGHSLSAPQESGFVQGFGRRPARTSATRATPVGRRSKATRERKRGEGAALSAGAMEIWLARSAQRGAARRAPELFGDGRHGRGVGRGVIFRGRSAACVPERVGKRRKKACLIVAGRSQRRRRECCRRDGAQRHEVLILVSDMEG